jgi:hypothetical protein
MSPMIVLIAKPNFSTPFSGHYVLANNNPVLCVCWIDGVPFDYIEEQMVALVAKASNFSMLAGDSFTCMALLFLLDRYTPR